MKNILLVIDATNKDMIDRSALDFACNLASLTRSKVTGVFLENLVPDEKEVMEKLQTTLFLNQSFPP